MNKENNRQKGAVKEALKSRNPDALLKTLSEQDRRTVEKTLKDPAALKKLLNSPEAAELMNLLNGKNSHG